MTNNKRVRKLHIDQIATTEDTNDPVIRAEFDDAGSNIYCTLPTDHDRIHVYLAVSNARGDMSKMLDEIVAQLETSTVWFLSPLDELKDDSADTLMERLHGFEEYEHEFTHPKTGETQTMDVYRGEWNVSDE